MDRDEIKSAVKEAMHEEFTRFGFTPENPHSMQEDVAFLRQWRRGVQSISTKIITTVTGAFVMGTLYLIWESIKK